MYVVLVIGLLAPAPAAADSNIVIESRAGFGTVSGNDLMPGAMLVAAPSVALVWRHGRIAVDLDSSLLSGGGPGEFPAYWSVGPGIRYHVPLATTQRNKVATELSAFGRMGFSRVWRTADALQQTGRGYSRDYSAGVEVSLSPLSSLLVAKLQLAVSRRAMTIAASTGVACLSSAAGCNSPMPLTAHGVFHTGAFGFSIGARF